MPRNRIPKLPGGATGYVVRRAEEAAARGKQGMKPFHPATMDPRLKKLLKAIKK